MPHLPHPLDPGGSAARPRWRLGASLALLALVALLTACTTGSNPTTPSPDPTPGGDEPPVGADAVYFVHGSGLGDATEQVVALFHTDDGVIDPTRPVEDAAVTLNGAVLAYDAARQRYVGSLPAALDPGAEVQLTIEVGEQRIEASGRVPQVATFTAPAPYTNFAVGDLVELAWDLEEDPDRYVVFLRYPFSAPPHEVTDGAARSTVLPEALVGSLPHDGTPVSYQLVAHVNGTFRGPAHPASSLGLATRTAADRYFSVGEAPPEVRYFVEGAKMGTRHQAVRVLMATDGVPDRSEPVLGLTGMVNGRALTYDAERGLYRVELPEALAAGDRLDLYFEGPLGAVHGVGRLPDQPRITAPTMGAELPAQSPVVVRWESPSDPAAFRVTIEGGPSPIESELLPGDARSYTFPAAALGIGDLVVRLEAIAHGSFSGPVAVGSTMGIHHEASNDVRFRRTVVIPDPPLP